MIDLARGCARFRPLLVDFVDRAEVGPATGAALAHLDRCTRCTEAIESTMLTITALRRMGDEAVSLEPAADAWPRLRIRIQVRRRRPAFMSPLAGAAMSFAIVAILVLPVRFGGSLLGPVSSSPSDGGSTFTAADRIEADYIAAVRQTGPTSSDRSTGEPGPAAATHPRVYPDNYRPQRKEVGPAEPTGRPPDAI